MTDATTNAGQWKSGTEAVTICMICGAEYEPGTAECPDCHVSLSIVRRCPSCNRIVSAQHTRCVYCRTPFTVEIPERLGDLDSAVFTGKRARSDGERRFRAATVSIVTFVLVFGLGLYFNKQLRLQRSTPETVARTYALRGTELRRAPSSTSSVVGRVEPGTELNITGVSEGERGERWMAITWNKSSAYIAATEVAPPKALDSTQGANALQFYLSGMEDSTVANDAVKAVDYYAGSFPGDAHIDELRWVLAERIHHLAQKGGSSDATLRKAARQQYEQLAKGSGKFAEKARNALSGKEEPTSPAMDTKPSRGRSQVSQLNIVGASEARNGMDGNTAHEVLVLNRTEVNVRATELSVLADGATIPGRVAHPVKTNGILAIPAGARCNLRVVNHTVPGYVTLTLTSITVDRRAYGVSSSTIDIPSGTDGKTVISRVLTFHLDKPLVIER